MLVTSCDIQKGKHHVDGELIQRELHNIKANDLKRLKRFAQLNIEIIIEEWNNRFGNKED